MAQESSEIRYSIIIKDIASSVDEGSVALSLSQIAKNLTLGQILKRLESLPWTLTKKATRATALKVAQRLEKAGAIVEIQPPLQATPTSKPPSIAPPRMESPTTDYASVKIPPSPVPVGNAAYRKDYGESVTREGIVPIEPLSLSGILDRTFQICKDHFWPLLGILVVPFVGVIVIFMVAGLVTALLGLAAWQTGGNNAPAVAAIVMLAVVWIGAFVAIIVLVYLSQGAVIHAVSQIYLGREISVKQSYEFMWPRTAKFILTIMLLGLVSMGMFISLFAVGAILFGLFHVVTGSGWWSATLWLPLLIIPMYAFPKLMLFDKVVVLEDIAYVQSLKRSWNLVSGQAEGSWPRGYWLKLVVLLHVCFFIYAALLMIFYIPSWVIEFVMPKSLTIVGIIIGAIIRNAGGLIAGLFGSVCLVVFYYDIRNRKEGFDLRLATESKESQNQF